MGQARSRQIALGQLALPFAVVLIPSARARSMHASQILLVPVARLVLWGALVVTLRVQHNVLLPVARAWQQVFSNASPLIVPQARSRQIALGQLALTFAVVLIPSARARSMHASQILLVPVARLVLWGALVVTLRVQHNVL